MEGGDRKALLLLARTPDQPIIRDALDLVDHRGDAIGRDHLESKAVALATLDGISKISSSGALEGEGGQENTCHFAKL
jgi:hypothetical protein